MGSIQSNEDLELYFNNISDTECQQEIFSYIIRNDDVVKELKDFVYPNESRKRRKSCIPFADTTWGKMLSDFFLVS